MLLLERVLRNISDPLSWDFESVIAVVEACRESLLFLASMTARYISMIAASGIRPEKFRGLLQMVLLS
jgi:hypothetical protein